MVVCDCLLFCEVLFFVGGVCGKNYNSIGIVNFNIAAKGDIISFFVAKRATLWIP